MKNLHIVEVKYLSATNNSGSRVKLYSARFNHYKIVPFNYQCNHSLDVATTWLKEQGHKILGTATGKNVDYVILDAIDGTFKELK